MKWYRLKKKQNDREKNIKRTKKAWFQYKQTTVVVVLHKGATIDSQE
jgi:hypothetical protein